VQSGTTMPACQHAMSASVLPDESSTASATHQFSVGQHDLGPKGTQQRPALDTHGVGHCQKQAVAFGCSHVRETDAGVAAGGLHLHNHPRDRKPGIQWQAEGGGQLCVQSALGC